MTRIVICRHGNTFDKGDVVTRVGARTDLYLSISGKNQAETLARHFSLKDSSYNFEKAFCSPLIRTHQTGDAILQSAHSTNHLKMLHFLTEIDYGVDENKAEEDVIARVGREAIDLWDEKTIPPKGWKVDPASLIQSWKDFFAKHKQFEGDILVVTSNGIARFALDAEIKNGYSKLTAWDIRAA